MAALRFWNVVHSSCVLVLQLKSFSNGRSSFLTNYCIYNEKKMNPSHEKWGYVVWLMKRFLWQRGHTGVGRHPSSGCRTPVPRRGDAEEHSVWTQRPAAALQPELCPSISLSSDRLALIHLKPVKMLSLACTHASLCWARSPTMYVVGCHDVKNLFQSKWFCDSI